MLPEFDHLAIGRAAARAGFSQATLAEICRVPAADMKAIFEGKREAGLMDLLRVAGALRLTMLQVFPWAKPQGPPVNADFEILTSNRERRWFRVVEADPASGDGGRAVGDALPDGRATAPSEAASGVCAAEAARV